MASFVPVGEAALRGMLGVVEVDDALADGEGAEDLAGESTQPPGEPGRHVAEVEQVQWDGELERGGHIVERGGIRPSASAASRAPRARLIGPLTATCEAEPSCPRFGHEASDM